MGVSVGRWFYKPLYLADDLEIMFSALPLFPIICAAFHFFFLTILMLNISRQVLFKTIAIGEGDCLPNATGVSGDFQRQGELGSRWYFTKNSFAGCPGGGRRAKMYPKGGSLLDKPT